MKVAVAFLTISLLLVLVVACHPLAPVTLDNETKEQLVFYTQSDAESALLSTAHVAAGSLLKTDAAEADYTWLRVAATREDGEWVFDHVYKRAELENAEKKVVVSSSEPIAPPSDVPVAPPVQATPPVAPAVTFDNETRQKLEFYTMSDTDGALTGAIAVDPRSSWATPDPRFGRGTVTGSFAWMRVAATRQDGQWVFDRTYTWDELVEAKRTIVVSSLEPVTPPANVKVVPLHDATPTASPTQSTQNTPTVTAERMGAEGAP